MPENSHDVAAQESVPAPQPAPVLGPAAPLASRLGRLDAATLLSVQRSAGNRAAARLVARQAAHQRGVRALQRAGGLLKPQKVQNVYGYWLLEIAKNRGVNAGDAAVDQAARAQTKVQVGALNFDNWVKWEQAQNAEIDAKVAEDAAKEKAGQEPVSPEAGLKARHDQMWQETAKIRGEVAQTEYLAHQLDFGGGAKGATARITAGSYTAFWGIGARTVSGVAEHVPLVVLSTVGFVFGSELAERTLIKQGKEIKRRGEEMGDDAGTAVRLVSGDTQAAYQTTRPSYAKWQAAFGAFSEASSRFMGADSAIDGINGLSARAKDIEAMEAAEKQMRDASDEYQLACAKAGIQSEAKNLHTMGKNIVAGSQEAVATAVTVGLPEVAPGIGELKGALKGARGMSARELEKEGEAAVAKALTRSGENAAATSGESAIVRTVEQAGGPTTAAEMELQQATGMPVKNQRAVADTCAEHNVTIEMRGTTRDAPALLERGNLPKPEAIKAKTINELDTYVGFRKQDQGLVGYMEPKKPVQSEVPPELWEKVNARYEQRASEFKDLSGEMQNLSLPPGSRDKFAATGFDMQVKPDSNGVVRVVEGAGGKPGTGFTGDHDIFRITNPDGTLVTGEKYNEVVSELVQKGVGVEHGAQMNWDVPAKPTSPAFKDSTKGFQKIVDTHTAPGAGGEDLYRFGPDRTVAPVRADAKASTLDAARAAGKADKAAAVPDIDKVVRGIGPQ